MNIKVKLMRYRRSTDCGDNNWKPSANPIVFFAIVPDEQKCQIMLVMEYMEGGSLADKLRDQKPLFDNSVIRYLTQILEGVGFLHRREIYHSINYRYMCNRMDLRAL